MLKHILVITLVFCLNVSRSDVFDCAYAFTTYPGVKGFESLDPAVFSDAEVLPWLGYKVISYREDGWWFELDVFGQHVWLPVELLGVEDCEPDVKVTEPWSCDIDIPTAFNYFEGWDYRIVLYRPFSLKGEQAVVVSEGVVQGNRIQVSLNDYGLYFIVVKNKELNFELTLAQWGVHAKPFYSCRPVEVDIPLSATNFDCQSVVEINGLYVVEKNFPFGWGLEMETFSKLNAFMDREIPGEGTSFPRFLMFYLDSPEGRNLFPGLKSGQGGNSLARWDGCRVYSYNSEKGEIIDLSLVPIDRDLGFQPDLPYVKSTAVCYAAHELAHASIPDSVGDEHIGDFTRNADVWCDAQKLEEVNIVESAFLSSLTGEDLCEGVPLCYQALSEVFEK